MATDDKPAGMTTMVTRAVGADDDDLGSAVSDHRGGSPGGDGARRNRVPTFVFVVCLMCTLLYVLDETGICIVRSGPSETTEPAGASVTILEVRLASVDEAAVRFRSAEGASLRRVVVEVGDTRCEAPVAAARRLSIEVRELHVGLPAALAAPTAVTVTVLDEGNRAAATTTVTLDPQQLLLHGLPNLEKLDDDAVRALLVEAGAIGRMNDLSLRDTATLQILGENLEPDEMRRAESPLGDGSLHRPSAEQVVQAVAQLFTHAGLDDDALDLLRRAVPRRAAEATIFSPLARALQPLRLLEGPLSGPLAAPPPWRPVDGLFGVEFSAERPPDRPAPWWVVAVRRFGGGEDGTEDRWPQPLLPSHIAQRPDPWHPNQTAKAVPAVTWTFDATAPEGGRWPPSRADLVVVVRSLTYDDQLLLRVNGGPPGLVVRSVFGSHPAAQKRAGMTVFVTVRLDPSALRQGSNSVEFAARVYPYHGSTSSQPMSLWHACLWARP